jgi:WD40 repeat protein/DNA-binding winged helix-turn-helix (wHTH) protein
MGTYTHLKVTSKTEHHELAEASFRLGEWLVEPRLNRLTLGDESIQIEHKMMDVLVCLAEQPGDLVPRQHIIDTVWAIEFISEGTLTRIVAELRRALGDDAREPRFIETIRGKGYRLLVPVEVELESSAKIAQFPVRATDDERNPYPGLAAFTETDAEFFYGREAEVSHLWRKITSRRLLAVIGPSGVGKTSFLRAGLLPAKPEGWRTLICQPGEAPFAALARALAPEFEGDAEAISKLVDMRDPARAVAVISRWRDRHDQALLIVDQFEELFTLNPSEIQADFAALMWRLARDVAVHVILSMRDDFLYRCHEHETLAPVFSGLTPIKVPAHDDLRRALVEPASHFGYAFEDDVLVDEMLDAVAGERGALPLLAFAVERLWVRRDRENLLLTRRAFADIGGVAGALAHHAEATIERIGADRVPIVRELFRNLITAEGTRAIREWDELLSVFSDSRSASQPEEVLRQLVDARLLTSYEIHEEDREPTRRAEIIHESLLANWPRLVRWQTQDADAVQLRDQLRQAARTWNERGRSDDLLWTGSAYREFSVWLMLYPGGLTETEEAFAEAMTSHAKGRSRRRRTAIAAIIVALFGVLTIVAGLWRRSVTEAQRAEAANLFSLAQLGLEERPSEAVAYAIAGLELADNLELRRMVLDALWRGPTEIRLETRSNYHFEFSPDGRWLGTADHERGAKIWPSDGGSPMFLENSDSALEIRFSPRGDLIAANTSMERNELGFWSFPEGRLLRTVALDEQGSTFYFEFSPDGERLITSTQIVEEESTELVIRSWPVGGGEPDVLARLQIDPSSNDVLPDLDPSGSRFAWADGRTVRIAPLAGTTLDLASATSIEHDQAVAALAFDSSALRLATSDTAKRNRVWALERNPPVVTCTLSGGKGTEAERLVFDSSGTMLAGSGGLLWDLTGPPNSEPLRLTRFDVFTSRQAFGPTGKWLATSSHSISYGGSVSLWPIARPYPAILRGHEEPVSRLAFTFDGKRLVSISKDGTVRVWPLDGGSREKPMVLDRAAGTSQGPASLATAPNGSFVAAGYSQGQVRVLPLDGSPGRELSGFTDAVNAVAVGPESRLVAAGAGRFFPEEAIVNVWDLESGDVRILDAGDGIVISYLWFTAEGDLWVNSGVHVIRRWDLNGDQSQMVEEIDFSDPEFAGGIFCDIDPDGRRSLLWGEPDRLWIQDLDTHITRELSSHGWVNWCEFDPTGSIVVTRSQGAARVGHVDGGEPHLLPGSERGANILVSPDGNWIASGGEDNTIRLWPMPDLSKTPLHTLPREELIAKLKTLTNLRAVRDEESSTGWKIEVGPFPGWETVPTW